MSNFWGALHLNSCGLYRLCRGSENRKSTIYLLLACTAFSFLMCITKFLCELAVFSLDKCINWEYT